MVETLRRIEEGIAHPDEIDLLLRICDNIEGNCLCPLGDACAMPMRSFVKRFREEFDEHVRQGGCTCPESSLRLARTRAPGACCPWWRPRERDRGRTPSASRSTDARSSCRRARRSSSRRLRTASRSRSSVTSPVSARRSARAACASSRSRAMPKLQAACTMTATDGMKVHTRNERAVRRAARRCSSSCCSTTRSTAPSATRAASARCRI